MTTVENMTGLRKLFFRTIDKDKIFSFHSVQGKLHGYDINILYITTGFC